MSIFNKAQIHGFKTGEYFCERCGKLMEFEDEEARDVLVCPKCGYSVDLDHYGFTDEEYEALYPTLEEVLGVSEEDGCEESETYEEVYDELGDD